MKHSRIAPVVGLRPQGAIYPDILHGKKVRLHHKKHAEGAIRSRSLTPYFIGIPRCVQRVHRLACRRVAQRTMSVSELHLPREFAGACSFGAISLR